jgi:hypothetical protein
VGKGNGISNGALVESSLLLQVTKTDYYTAVLGPWQRRLEDLGVVSTTSPLLLPYSA